MDWVYLQAGIGLATALVLGVLSDRPRLGWWRELGRAGAWSGVVGGGVYGLLIYDSSLIPQWSFGYLIVVAGATLVMVMAVRMTGKGGEL